MSTRSLVALKLDDGTFDVIYCHWDGHPRTRGAILTQHYDTAEKVAALLALGDLSVLHTELGEKHDFEARACDVKWDKPWCCAYGRDRGEEDVNKTNKRQYLILVRMMDGYNAEWLYSFEGGKWYFMPETVDGEKKELTEAAWTAA